MWQKCRVATLLEEETRFREENPHLFSTENLDQDENQHLFSTEDFDRENEHPQQTENLDSENQGDVGIYDRASAPQMRQTPGGCT